MAKVSDGELRFLKETCAVASPGPWMAWTDHDEKFRPHSGIEVVSQDQGVLFLWKRATGDTWSPGMRPEDAEFCALARNLVPALLEELMELRGLRDADESGD